MEGHLCTECGTKLQVKETRRGDGEPILFYRRRYCPTCDDALWTVEIPFSGKVPNEVRFPNFVKKEQTQ